MLEHFDDDLLSLKIFLQTLKILKNSFKNLKEFFHIFVVLDNIFLKYEYFQLTE